MAGSYGRNTQNDQFLSDPATCRSGCRLVARTAWSMTEMFNARLTSKPIRTSISACGYTYNDRDNKTPVNTYAFYDAGEPKTGASSFNAALGLRAGTLGSNINIYANRPVQQEGEHGRSPTRITSRARAVAQGRLRVPADRPQLPGFVDQLRRRAEDAARTRCTLREDGKHPETLSARLSYAYSQRRVDYNENAWLALVPMANVVPGAPTVGATTSVGRTS